MASVVSYNRYAHRAQTRVRAHFEKFFEFEFCTLKYTFVQKISSKYDFWGEL